MFALYTVSTLFNYLNVSCGYHIQICEMFLYFQVAEAVVQAGNPFDVSAIMNLVTILSNRKPDELNGLLALVITTILLMQATSIKKNMVCYAYLI